MIVASRFLRLNPQERLALIEPDPRDRPLIVQFASDDPETLLAAARLAEDYCDAVDLNLGCPQPQAVRDHYGSILMEEPELVGKWLMSQICCLQTATAAGVLTHVCCACPRQKPW